MQLFHFIFKIELEEEITLAFALHYAATPIPSGGCCSLLPVSVHSYASSRFVVWPCKGACDFLYFENQCRGVRNTVIIV